MCIIDKIIQGVAHTFLYFGNDICQPWFCLQEWLDAHIFPPVVYFPLDMFRLYFVIYHHHHPSRVKSHILFEATLSWKKPNSVTTRVQVQYIFTKWILVVNLDKTKSCGHDKVLLNTKALADPLLYGPTPLHAPVILYLWLAFFLFSISARPSSSFCCRLFISAAVSSRNVFECLDKPRHSIGNSAQLKVSKMFLIEIINLNRKADIVKLFITLCSLLQE